MRHTRVVGLLGIVAAVALASSAASAPQRASETLRVKAQLRAQWKFGDAYCPQGKPVNVACVRFVGRGTIPGLGQAKSTYVKTLENNGCRVTQFNEAVIGVKGKGTLTLSRLGKACGQTAPAQVGPLTYAVDAGTGAYEGASGSLTFRSTVHEGSFGCGPCGGSDDSWNGTLTVPGLDFDVTAPVIRGAAPRTVVAPKTAKSTRVRYAVTATDEVDGSVAVTCAPASGAFFGRGKTTVTCSASDSSGNTGRTQFVITVK